MSAISDLVSRLIVAPGHVYKALSVHPLVLPVAAQADPAQAEPGYLVLDQALATGRFRVTEVSDVGSVPQLLAVNDLDQPVFLLDGEELVGAKQNRVLNLSVMIAPHARTTIPVSCVEMGRWRQESDAFASAPRAQFAEGRARKMASVTASLHSNGSARSDQGEVWERIAAKAARMDVASDTGAMAALFEGRRDTLDDYMQALSGTVEGQVGAVYAIAGQVAGLDVFDAPSTWRRLAPKIHASYALDAMEHEAAPTGAVDAAAFLRQVASAPGESFPGAGIGRTLRLGGTALAGAALDVDGRCVHLAAFPVQREAEGEAPHVRAARMTRSSHRARRH